MARGPTKSLYLEIGGDIRGLKAATSAGKTVLNDFGGAAVNILEEVEKEMAKLGSAGLPNLKTVENAYTASFKRISESARAVINAPTPQAAVQIIDVNATRQAAERATSQAAALRLVAEAASRADLATGGTDKATRAYAASAATAAVNAESEAQALRDQLAVLSKVEGQLGVNAGALKRNVAVNGQARAGYQQLSFQLGDVATQYAAGTAGSIIFAQQSGQVIQAISLITGEAKGFIGFIGGPWGIALSSALVVLTPWVAKLLEGDTALGKETESLKENAEKAAITDRAKAAFATTEAGLIDDVRQLTEELKKQNDALRTNAELANIRAKKDLKGLSKQRGGVVDELAQARITLKAQVERASGPGQQSEVAALGIDRARQDVTALESRLKAIDVKIADANAARLETQKDLAAEAAKRNNDPVAAINRRYDGAEGLIEAAKKQATAEETVNGVLTRRLYLLDQQQKAEVKAAQAREAAAKKTPNNQQIGREIDVVQAKAIVASIGGRVTSGVRSPEKQAQLYADKLAGRHDGPVAKPGTSAHETGNAIDVAYGPGISIASIREAFKKEGVALRKILNEPGQKVFHVEFGKAGKSPDAQARSASAEADRRTQNADAYASLLSRAQEQLLQIERSRVTSISEAADLDVATVELKRDALIREADKGVALKKWSDEEAKAAKGAAVIAAVLETNAIREREQLQLANKRFDIEQADLDDKVALLRLQGDLSTVAADRRAIALQLLKIEQKQVEDALKQRIANERDPDTKRQLERRLAQVPKEFELKGEKLDRENQDPLQAYGQGLIDETADLETALKGVAARGFGAIEDASAQAAASAIADFLKLRGVAGRVIGDIIADLAKLAIKKAIVGIFGSFLGQKDGGPILKRAGGGMIYGPGGPRDDLIPTLLSNGEFVINATATARHRPLIEAINDNRVPKFADGGLVATTSFVPRLPNIEAARTALQGGRSEERPIRIVLGVTKGEAFAAEVLSVSGPATVQILQQSMPAIADASAARTLEVIGRPGI